MRKDYMVGLNLTSAGSTHWVPEALSSISTTVALNRFCCSRT